MKKRLLVLPLAAMLLAGCGGSPNPNPNPNPEEGPVVPTKTLTGIEVTTQPTKVNYKEGETFNPAGMVVNAVYDDGSKEAVTNYQISNQALVVGTTSVEISYEGKKATVTITVTPLPTYVVTFMASATEKIADVTYKEGQVPSYSYNKPSTAEFDYSFVGWSSTVDGQALASLPKVTGDATYYAVIRETKRKYNITFKYDNGSSYKVVEVEYGLVPSVAIPSKAQDQQYSYTFSGWSATQGGAVLDSLPSVTGAATYFAVFEGTLRSYNISFVLNNSKTKDPISFNYGTKVAESDLGKPTKDGYLFAGWYSDSNLRNKVSFPYEVKGAATFYAAWEEKVNIKDLLVSLFAIKDQDPYGFIPETMRPNYETNYVTEENILNFETSAHNVSSIKKQGFGEQWQMVLDNLAQSERFYKVLSVSDGAVSAIVTTLMNFFKDNEFATEHTEKTALLDASAVYSSGILTLNIKFNKSVSIPFFANISPEIIMSYELASGEKTMSIALNENNRMKVLFTDTIYQLAIEYGIDQGKRTALCQLIKDDDEYVGHIYEYITLLDKTVVNSCADFYIDDTYVSVVGNKASGLFAFTNTINELYKVSNGNLIGYEIEETLSLLTYHTLWFNIFDITGINKVYMEDNGAHKDDHWNVYLNDAVLPFKERSSLGARRYDVELRNHYYYGLDADENVVSMTAMLPMMFIQEKYLEDFSDDMMETSGFAGVSVNVSTTHINKIIADHEEMLPAFKENKENVTAEDIEEFLK